MQAAEVTVEAALKRGRLMLKTAPLSVFILLILAAVFLGPKVGLPTWTTGIALALAFPLAWLTWSVLVTRWRIWALLNVRNTHELFDTAVAEKLIWPEGSWFQRTEIRTAGQRATLVALGVRLGTPDVWNDDTEVPDVTEIRWSRNELIVISVTMIVIALVGVYLIIKNPSNITGWGMIGIAVFVGGMDVRKLSDRRTRIRLDDQGITPLDQPCIPWETITEDRVTVKGSGRSSQTALEFRHPNGAEEIRIDQMDLSKEELRHRLRVYRFRSGHFPKHSS